MWLVMKYLNCPSFKIFSNSSTKLKKFDKSFSKTFFLFVLYVSILFFFKK